MESHQASLDQSLGLASTTALGLGAMIGAGIFVLTGMGAGEAGPALILAFALNGIIALIVGACYAELAAMWPRAGGAYVWAKPAFGSLLGFFAGWMSWFAQAIACALYATAFGSFAVEFLFELGQSLPAGAAEHAPTLISIALLIALLAVNYRGTRDAGRFEIAVTGIKIAILLVVVASGFSAMAQQGAVLGRFTPFMPEGVAGLLGAMGLTFIAFEGYEIIVQTAEEVERPARTIPRAIGLSILVAVTIYILVAVVLFGGLRVPEGTPVYRYLAQFGELGIMEAAGQFVPFGKPLLLVAGLASTASALNATIYGSTRIAYALGRDGDLPALFSHIHPTHHTPHRAIQLSGLLMIIGTVALPIRDIAAAADIMFLWVFVLVCATVIRLRKRWPERARPFRVAFVPLLPMIGIIAGLVLSLALFTVSVRAWLAAGAWLALGLFVHFFSNPRTREGDED